MLFPLTTLLCHGTTRTMAPLAMTLRRMLYLVVLAFSVAPADQAAAQIIDSFDYTSASVTNAWRAIGEAPAARTLGNGSVDFPVPFGDDRDRAYWDLDGHWDLSACTGFELDIACPDPQAMRSLSLYFRSGDGWYIWNQPLPSAGRQKIVLSKSQFSTEGSPSGWSSIDKVRLSPWKGRPMDTVLTLHHLAGRREAIYLVTATASAPTAAERSASQRAADRIGRWLKGAGIPHAIVEEDQLERVAGSASTILLPYSPRIPDAAMPALRNFRERGGKLLVFYSSDDRLAALMGVQLGSFTNTRDIARWRGMAFNGEPPPGIPPSIHQQSWNIGPAQPLDDRTSVIARWINAKGEASDEPAILASPSGYWFTHLLLDDDMMSKQRLVAGLLASLDASLWQTLSDHAVLNAGRIDGWQHAEEAIAALTRLSEQHPDGETLRASIQRITALNGLLREHHEAGRHREATLTGYELTDLLIRTYGQAQSSAPGEFRGVWDHDGTGWYPGDWKRTAQLFADSGINAIFVNSTWTGLAHYQSKFLPDSFSFRIYGDQLAQCIEAARPHGMQVHAWIVCWNIENAPPEFTQPLRGTDRLQQTSSGTERLWLNPAHPENRAHLLNVIEELATNYPLDGIHLDYIRFPAGDSCFSPYTRARFEEATGIVNAQWPQDVLAGGIHREAFVTWRAELITSFVKEARERIKAIKPELRLSAAVWGGYPQIIASIGQDWGAWMEQGLLDFVCPMNYAQDLYRFTALIDRQLPLPGVAGKVYPGIGVTANESQLRGDEVVEQILALRQRGVGGFLLYDLSQTLVDDVLPTLRQGVTKP